MGIRMKRRQKNKDHLDWLATGKTANTDVLFHLINKRAYESSDWSLARLTAYAEEIFMGSDLDLESVMSEIEIKFGMDENISKGRSGFTDPDHSSNIETNKNSVKLRAAVLRNLFKNFLTKNDLRPKEVFSFADINHGVYPLDKPIVMYTTVDESTAEIDKVLIKFYPSVKFTPIIMKGDRLLLGDLECFRIFNRVTLDCRRISVDKFQKELDSIRGHHANK